MQFSNKPMHISEESDLSLFEEFLQTDTLENLSKPQKEERMICKSGGVIGNINTDLLDNSLFFQGYLKNHRGKLVRVESLVGCCLESRVGKLLDVGMDYIVIKLYKNGCSMMLKAKEIKYITIVHDNDASKTLMW